MVFNESLIAIAQQKATGKDIHDLIGLICAYKNAFPLIDMYKQNKNTIKVQVWEDYAQCYEQAIRAFVAGTNIKTCQKIADDLFDSLNLKDRIED